MNGRKPCYWYLQFDVPTRLKEMKGTSSAFRELASVIETVETGETVTADPDITSVTPVGEDLLADTRMSAEIKVRIPGIDFETIGGDVEIDPGDVELADDGSIRTSFVVTVEQTEDGERTPTSEETTTAADQNFEPQVDDSTGESSDEPESEVDAEETPSSGRDSDCEADGGSVTHPPYRDPDRLQEVYETCDTFAEMTEALDVDVTPQTVRRYTIKHGIHEPSPKTRTADSLLNSSPDSIPSPAESGDETEVRDETSSDATESSDSAENSKTDAVASASDSGSDTSDSAEIDDEDSPETRNESTRRGEIPTTENGARPPSEGVSEVENASKDADTSEAEGTSETENTTEAEAVGDGGVRNATPDEVRELNELNRDGIDERTIAEGVDLPDHLTLTEIQDVVRTSKTLYEAQRELSLDRDEARQLLQDLNLLDLVHGRLSRRNLEEQSIDEINRRIRSTMVDGRA